MTNSNDPTDSSKVPVSRRRVMRTVGAGSVSIPGIIAGSTSGAADEDWDCTDSCPQEEVQTKQLELPDPAGSADKLEGAASIHWKESGYSSQKGKWFHIFSVSGGASSESSGVLGGHVHGQHYKLETSDGDIQPSTEGDKHGHLPGDDDGSIPDWGAPLLEAAIGTVSVGMSWFLAVGQALREEFGRRPDGFEIFGGGFEYGDMAFSITSPNPWKQSAFFHRVELETEEVSPVVDVKLGICHHDSTATTLWKDLEGELDFFGSSGDPGFSPDKLESDPSKMSPETREKLGIEDVRKQEETITSAAASEEVKLDYIVRESPISRDGFEVVERDESEMDEPRSKRFRERLNKPAPSDY